MKRPLIWALPLLVSVALAAFGQKHTLLIFHPGPHAVEEFDPAAGKVLRSLTVAEQPHEAVMTPQGKIFCTLPSLGEVAIIDAATFQQTGKIESEYFKVPPHPQGRSGKMTTSASPHALGITQDGSKLYIGLSYREAPGVVVYDVASAKVLKKINLPVNGEFLAIQPETGKLYYPNREGVVIIDTRTDAVLKTIPLKGQPTGVDFAPNGEVWVSENGDGSVTVIDSKKDEVVKVLTTSGKGAGRMAVSPDGKWAAASHTATKDVVLFDARTKEIAASIAVGEGPSLPIFSPDSATLYVATAGETCDDGCPGRISVIDVQQKKRIAEHAVADDAFALIVRKVK